MAVRRRVVLKFYISGPMRGLPGDNYDQFNEVEAALTARLSAPNPVGYWHAVTAEGFEVLNPARNFGGDRTRALSEYMQADLEMVLQADIMVMLPGWENSEGAAQREVPLALWTGKGFLQATPTLTPGHWDFVRMEPPQLPALANGPVTGLTGAVRAFDSGATRDTDDGKLDYEGFLSPAVLKAFAQYMHTHRVQSDGSLRSADNWQKGMPREVYMSSMFRHFMDVWQAHRGLPIDVPHLEALMALLFNVQGYAFELLRAQPDDFPRLRETLRDKGVFSNAGEVS